jgi:hypothetical protein
LTAKGKASVSKLPLIRIAWVTVSEPVDGCWLLERAIGVKGGEAISTTISLPWRASRGLDACEVVTLGLLEGIEKLRAMVWGGVGSGDAAFDTTDFFVAESTWSLDPKGAEWPTKSIGLEDLEVELAGGLGSSWSSLILGEDIKVGEVLGDVDGTWDIGFRRRGPEYKWGLPTETGLVDHGLLVNGPEKAYLLSFLGSEAASIYCCENKTLSAEGGCSQADALLLLSLSTDWAFITVGPENFSSTKTSSNFFCSSGDECHKFWVCSFRGVSVLWGIGLPDPVEIELFISTGVGSTYVCNFRVDDSSNCFVFSVESNLFSAKSGADWLPGLALWEKEFRWSLYRFSCKYDEREAYTSEAITMMFSASWRSNILEGKLNIIKGPGSGVLYGIIHMHSRNYFVIRSSIYGLLVETCVSTF